MSIFLCSSHWAPPFGSIAMRTMVENKQNPITTMCQIIAINVVHVKFSRGAGGSWPSTSRSPFCLMGNYHWTPPSQHPGKFIFSSLGGKEPSRHRIWYQISRVQRGVNHANTPPHEPLWLPCFEHFRFEIAMPYHIDYDIWVVQPSELMQLANIPNVTEENPTQILGFWGHPSQECYSYSIFHLIFIADIFDFMRPKPANSTHEHTYTHTHARTHKCVPFRFVSRNIHCR